ncbi:MAG TPA: VOC family protein [Streptosporangiaceae bacterium]|nr:VOC family protein [Streptosporangiaceae bacterium]
MVTRDTPWPAGTPCWVDLGVGDVAKATAFYRGLFGWDIQAGPPEAGGYSMCMLDGRAVAGIGQQMNPGTPPFWTTYLASDDADATAAKITAAGGQVMMEPFEVMDVGRMFVASDPGGAAFGVWQARAHTGVGMANEPGSLAWNENMSRSFEVNKAFYHEVFGYDYTDIGGGDMEYATLDLAGGPVGGIGGLGPEQPASRPASWVSYFAVTDTDAAVAKAVELGGMVIAPPFDTPYGRMAAVADDQGAAFAVMTSAPPGES